jgi:hypothetical protein
VFVGDPETRIRGYRCTRFYRFFAWPAMANLMLWDLQPAQPGGLDGISPTHLDGDEKLLTAQLLFRR